MFVTESLPAFQTYLTVVFMLEFLDFVWTALRLFVFEGETLTIAG